MLVALKGVRSWQTPKPGRTIGPEYRFLGNGWETNLVTNLPGLGPKSFRALVSPKELVPASVQLIEPPQAASLIWETSCASLESVRIENAAYKRTGLASILGNIFLRTLKAEQIPFNSVSATTTLAFNDSDLNVIGWLGRFGVSCFRSEDLQRFFAEFPALQASVKCVENSRPAQYYLWLVDRRGLSDAIRPYKGFLYREGGNLGLHERLANDKNRLAALIRQQQAFVNLPLYMDPRKAAQLERYAAKLPANPHE
jgi:hypothetical protein